MVLEIDEGIFSKNVEENCTDLKKNDFGNWKLRTGGGDKAKWSSDVNSAKFPPLRECAYDFLAR